MSPRSTGAPTARASPPARTTGRRASGRAPRASCCARSRSTRGRSSRSNGIAPARAAHTLDSAPPTHSTPHAPPPSHHTRPRPRLAPTGEYLLTGSFDETTIVWDAATGAVKQQFSFHNKPTLDVRRAPLGQRTPRGRAPHALPLPPAGGLARRDVVRVVLDRQDGVRVQGGAGLVPQVLRGPPGRGARAAPAHATAGRPLPSAAPPRR